MTLRQFQDDIRAGIPAVLPEPREYDPTVNHAPKRKDILSSEEKKLALRNALRYFPKEQHAILAPEFAKELADYLHVPPPPALRYVRPPHRPVPRALPPGRRDHANDPEQPRSRRGPASTRTDYIRRQRSGVPELGAVPPCDEIPQRDDRRTDSRNVLRPPARSLPLTSGSATRRGHQRHG